jgi:hypothetical protein
VSGKIDNIVLNITCVKTINFDPYWYTSFIFMMSACPISWLSFRFSSVSVSNFSFTCQIGSFFLSNVEWLLTDWSKSVEISSTRLRIINKYQKHIIQDDGLTQLMVQVKKRQKKKIHKTQKIYLNAFSDVYTCLAKNTTYMYQT